jgi:hypothetical protein
MIRQATALKENTEPEWILRIRDRATKRQVNGKAERFGEFNRRPRHGQTGTTIVQAVSSNLEDGIASRCIPKTGQRRARRTHPVEQREWKNKEQDEEYEAASRRQKEIIRAQHRMNEKLGDAYGQQKKHRAVQKKENAEASVLDFVRPRDDRQRHGHWRRDRVAQFEFTGDYDRLGCAFTLAQGHPRLSEKPVVDEHMVRRSVEREGYPSIPVERRLVLRRVNELATALKDAADTSSLAFSHERELAAGSGKF